MYMGVDLGSRAIKAAAVEGGRLVGFHLAESGFDPHRQALEMLKGYSPRRIIATGYGRHLARRHFAEDAITEIKAHAIGARYFLPAARTIVDVGGQDSKAIALTPDGKVAGFQMNDKCAAGTGRFLEIMAATLGFALDEFHVAAMEALETTPVNSMCTVFAESEVIGLKNHGAHPGSIARALHMSVVQRLAGMLHKVGVTPEVVFTGGVARNAAMVGMLSEAIGLKITVPERPEITGALGAALYAEQLDSDGG